MEMNELEREIINLAKEIQQEKLPDSVVPATMNILHCHCETGTLSKALERGGRLRRGNLVLSVVARRFLQRQSRLPVFIATLLLLFLFIPFFSFSSELALNVARLVLLLFSIAAGTALFFKPETMAEIDRKILGNRLSRIGPSATHSQEILLFRVQAIYFILIAVFICRL